MVRSNYVRQKFPLRAAYCRHGLPHVRGFPTRRVLCVIRRRIRIRRAFPVTVLLRLPGVPGADGASQVLRRLSSCMPRPVDSGGPAPPRHNGWVRVAFGRVKTLGVRNSHVEAVPALQGARSPLRPTGYAVYASSILFAGITTPTPPWTQDSIRVGGEPLPDRDSHPVRDAKLAWRDNARCQPLPEAEAQRKL